MQYKVLLTTSGTGSRLGELTKNTNKALVPVNGRPTIEYVLDLYPKDITFVVTLGYLGQSVKDYLLKNYQDRNFEFAWVDKYEGPGSSVGYSMLQAKEYLQCPFIFHACDTILTEKIPAPETNWIGGYVEDWPKSEMKTDSYNTCSVENGYVVRLNERGTPGFDAIYLGFDGIFDHKLYWEILESLYQADPMSSKLHPIQVLNEMLRRGVKFKFTPYSVWLDTGNLPALAKTEEFLKTSMDKKIGLVIQGPLISIGRTGGKMRQSVEQLQKEGGVIHYDCRENINKIIKEFGYLFDEIVISTWDNEVKEGENFPGAKLVSQPDPGGIKQAGHYKDNNKYRQFLSTHLGLVELEKDNIDYAVKTRTDIYLDFGKLLGSFFKNDTKKIGATVMHPKTFLLHDLYFVAELKKLKDFCEAILSFDRFEFIPSVHREMVLKHAYVEYRNKIGVPDWAYFPVYPPTGVNAATRKIFDYMFENVYFSLPPSIFKETLWRGTYFPEDHVSSLTKGNVSSRKYNVPAFISTDWQRYFAFRQEVYGKKMVLQDKITANLGKWGWDLWNLTRKVVNMLR
ncbi:MAG: WavE lipopolysaccharide synthesis family protein [Patescibacteria group bacterium]